MDRITILAALLIVVCAGLSGAADVFTVNGTGPCTANVLKNGAAYKMINLTSLDSKNATSPKFTIQGKTYKYFYNPCTGMNVNALCKTNEAVCQNLGTNYYSAGKQNFTSYNMSKTGQLMMQYTEDPTNAKSRASIFLLLCNASATAPSIVFNSENPLGHYNFNFTWVQFCNLTSESDSVGMEQGVEGTHLDIDLEPAEQHMGNDEEFENDHML